MIFFTTHTNPRIAYMAHWLGMRLCGKPLTPVTNLPQLGENDLVLNYTNQPLENRLGFWIKPHILLFENTITAQQIDVKLKDGLPYFFETTGDHHFDILAASFYLMQRYEEYLPHTKDMYGRYAHQNSLAFKHQFLHLPLVDLWMLELSKALALNRVKMSANPIPPAFSFRPTYDIDIAYAYKGKGFLRNIAGVARAVGQWNLLKERRDVLMGKRQDPFDVFDELDSFHLEYSLNPVYFFLVAKQRLGYDHNIAPSTTEMKNLMGSVAQKYVVGIHPGWQSGDDESLLKTEIAILATHTKKTISISRQHYIRMRLPETYELLIAAGITNEHSMGYGSINGFRAATSVPYYWYNLQMEKATALLVSPFCYMDANAIFEQKDTPLQALEELKQFHAVVKKVGGTLITIFHNHLVGLDNNGRKWMDMYKAFLAYQALH